MHLKNCQNVKFTKPGRLDPSSLSCFSSLLFSLISLPETLNKTLHWTMPPPRRNPKQNPKQNLRRNPTVVLPPAMKDRWFDLSDRRRRLRSGSRLRMSLNGPFMDNGNAATQMPQDPHSEPDQTMDALAEADYELFLQHLRPHGKSYVFDMDAVVDADYELFLEHLRPHGKSYVFDMAVGGACGSPLRLEYEAVKMMPPSLKTERSVSSSSAGEMMPPERGSPSPDSAEFSDPCSLLAGEANERRSTADEDYLEFLKYLRLEGDVMVIELGNGLILRYEGEGEKEGGEREGRGEEEIVGEGEEEIVGEGEEKGDGEQEEAQNSSGLSDNTELQLFSGSPQPSDTSASDLWRISLEILEYRALSRFSLRLKNTLRKPFNQREYDRLIAMATVRSPIVKYRQLRDRCVPYATNILGYSYFDHYPDLARQIECADSRRGLVLLRGFFFWLQNVGHDGAFMPWVLPASSSGTLLTGSCSSTSPLQVEMLEG